MTCARSRRKRYLSGVDVISMRSLMRRRTMKYAHMATLLHVYNPRQSRTDALQLEAVFRPIPLLIAAAETTKPTEKK
jgi:hypothetical protein